MRLRDQFGIEAGDVVAFTGAGGKTSAIFFIAREFDSPVLVSTSTHLGTWQAALADRHIDLNQEALPSAEQLQGLTLLTAASDKPDRLGAPDYLQMERIRELAAQCGCPLLIEADGAKGRALKAPADYEPVVPAFTDHVIVCAGMSALGQPLSSDWVHRAERFASLSGLRMGERVTVEALARVLAQPLGGLKGVPPGARVSLLLNQVDDHHTLAAAQRLAGILREAYGSIALVSLTSGKVFG